MPADSETTFVVQGPICTTPPYSTAACLESIRRHFPASRIVLSTWVGSACEGLAYDQLVLNDDPSAPFGYHVPGNRHDRPNSINRMIVSTRNGLQASSTSYSVKVRTDFVFTSNAILRRYDILHHAFPHRQPAWVVFEDRILSPNLYCVDSSKQGLPYHISDILHVGRTTDLRTLWDIPLMSLEEMRYCFDHNLLGHEYQFAGRYCSEQWLWLQCLAGKGIQCATPRYYYDTSDTICRDATSLLLNNFLIIDYRDCGVVSKFDVDRLFRRRCWTYPAFLMKYKRDVEHRSLPDRDTVHLLLQWYRNHPSWKWVFESHHDSAATWVRICGVTFDVTALRDPMSLAPRQGNWVRRCTTAATRFLLQIRRFKVSIDVRVLGVRIHFG